MASTLRPLDLDTLTMDSFADQHVAVLGLARSGLALTRFLVDRGAVVTAYDARSEADLAPGLASLGERRPRLLLGADVDPRAALAEQSLICTSPSVNSRYPTTEPRLRAALGDLEAAGRIPVVSEVDLFLRLCPGSTVGVTGTKGKTTTSSLIAAVLRHGAAPVALGGNIGVPLIDQLPRLTADHRVVLELSELQLPTLSRGTDVAVYTHVTSDHLDRHGTLEAYRSVKRRLAALLPEGGVLVRNDDDPVVREYAAPPSAATVTYSQQPPAPGGVGVEDGWIVASGVEPLALAVGGPGREADESGAAPTQHGARLSIMPLDEIPIPGRHNVSNVLAATAVGRLYGLDPASIRAAVAAFPGVEHRLEQVATVHGIRYVNDSQGTQPDAVIAALNSFSQPLVLIAGGRSKGVAIDALAAVVAERVNAAVLIGETAPELETAFRAAGLARIEHADSMAAAVEAATTIASELSGASQWSGMAEASGATVLLSPAAASFDMFSDYEARGAAFKSAVGALAGADTTTDTMQEQR